MVTKQFVRCLLPLSIIALLAAGCKGSGGSDGADNLKNEDLLVGEDVIYTAIPKLPAEDLKNLYSNIPTSDLSTWDLINACEAYGNCTRKVAIQQKILYYFDHPLLDPRFKTEERHIVPCGNSHRDEILYEISKDQELKNFYDAAAAQSEASLVSELSQRSISSKAASVGLKEGEPSLEPGAVHGNRVTEIETADRQFTFNIRSDDSEKPGYLKINKRKVISTGEGWEFDLYYESGIEPFADAITECVQNPKLWQVAKEITDPGLSLKKFPGHDRPTIFLISSDLHGDAAGYFFGIRSPLGTDRGGYITISTHDFGASPDFIRGKTPDLPDTQILKSYCAHELNHFILFSFQDAGTIMYNYNFEEAEAEWFAGQAYPGEGMIHGRYMNFIYYPHLPFDAREPGDHEYGAMLLWSYLSSRYPERTDPVRIYNHCLNGNNEYECIKRVFERNDTKIEDQILKYAESAMNLGDQAPPDTINFKYADPAYKKHYLAGAYGPLPIWLFDGMHSRWTEGIYGPKMEIEVGSSRFSVRHYAFVSYTGDTMNNYYKLDASEVCTKPGVACSLMGFVMNEDEPNKRNKYTRVFYEKFQDSGVVSYTATETNKEPEIMIFTIANGNLDESDIRGTVYLETKTFSRPVDFNIVADHNASFADGGYTHQVYTYEGTLYTPEPSFPVNDQIMTSLPAIPTMIEMWDETRFSEDSRARHDLTRSFVPFQSGSLDIEYESVHYERFCFDRHVVRTTLTCNETVPMDFEDGDSAHLQLEVKEAPDGTPLPEGRLDLEIHYRNNELDITCYEEQACEPCDFVTCEVPPLESGAVLKTIRNNTYIYAVADYTDGAMSLVLAFPRPAPGLTVWGTINFPEPIEVPRAWSARGTEPYTYGGLYGAHGAGKLMYQFRPPIIDFPWGRGPARAAQWDLPASVFDDLPSRDPTDGDAGEGESDSE